VPDVAARCRRGLLLVAAAGAVGACGDGGPAAAPGERDGLTVPSSRLEVHQGSEHCDWASVTFLSVAWPSDADRSQYVRDPDGVLSADLAGRLRLDAALPADAVTTGMTGLTDEGTTVWLAPDGSTAYLADGAGGVEAWPEADPPWRCG
jgi:hypothetical protein